MLHAIAKCIPGSGLLLMTILTPLRAQRAATDHTALDHILIGAADLAVATRQFSELTGVNPQFGGVHPGRGTQNALASLGSHNYLELLAPVPDSTPSEERVFLTQLHGLVPVGFAITTDNLDATARRLTAAGYRVDAPRDGARTTPSGKGLRWRTAALPDVPTAMAPFLIEWDPATPHPSTTSPAGCRLEELEIAVADAPRLEALLAAVNVHATIRASATAEMRVTLQCAKGRVVLGGQPPR